MLRLYLAEGEFLVDVGFGSANPPRALPLPGDEADAGQVHCVRLVDPHAGLYESAVRGRSGWLPLYRFDLRPQLWIDYIPRNWYTSTHPHSVFRQGLKAAITEGDLRLTLADGLFGQRAGNGETLQRQLRDVDELLDILQTRFACASTRPPKCRAGATAGRADLRLSAFGRRLFAGLLREFSDVP